MATVTAAPGSALNVLKLVAAAAGVAIDVKEDASAAAPQASSVKMTVSGVNTCAQFLAAQKASPPSLLGSTPEEEAQAGIPENSLAAVAFVPVSYHPECAPPC